MAEKTLKASEVVEWAVTRWVHEVSRRPLQNIYRRTLDGTWRQVIRHYGGDDEALCGPRHDELLDRRKPPPPEITMTDAERADNDIIRFILSRCTDETEDHIKVIAKSILSALTAAGRVIVDAGEWKKAKTSYRCYSCKQVFEEDHGSGLARDHFGNWLKKDFPKCVEVINGTATWGGGPHDPFYRVRKDVFDRMKAAEPRLTEAERDLAAAHALLREAGEGLLPFVKVNIRDKDPDDNSAACGSLAVREILEGYAEKWDYLAEKGMTLPFARPNPDVGWKDWPQEIFGVDLISIGQFRTARAVATKIAAMLPPETSPTHQLDVIEVVSETPTAFPHITLQVVCNRSQLARDLQALTDNSLTKEPDHE